MWTPQRIAKARTEAGRFPRCFDCVGLIKGYLWLQPGGALRYIATQDKTADGMRAASSPQPLSTLPEVPGVLVFMPGHVGVYIGGGRVIECYGFRNVANRPLSAQRWTSWGRCPYIQYPDAPKHEKPVPRPAEATESIMPGDRVRVKTNALYYYPGGTKVPDWLKGQVKTVDQVLRAGRTEMRGGERCVLLGDGIDTWISVENINKVKE
jgi:hypothetical protein